MKNIFAQFHFEKDKDRNKWYPNIRRDWAIIFLCAAVLTIFFLSLHLYLYLEMQTDGFFSRSSDIQTNTTEVVNRQGLIALIADFAAKKERFDQITTEPITIADPSTGVAPLPSSNANAAVNTLLSQ
jgi:hypothetical protein